MDILLTLYAYTIVLNVSMIMALTSEILRGDSVHEVVVRCGWAVVFILSGFIGWLTLVVRRWHDNAVEKAAELERREYERGSLLR